MSISNNTKLIRAALFTPTKQGWGLPIIFWGGPGGGKTSVISEAAAEFGLPLEVLSPGERGEGAFGVTPMPDADGYISYPPPRWTERFTEATGGVVFVDEFNLAPPAIQAPILGLVLAKRIGGMTLPGRVRILAAANEVHDAAGGHDLAPPTANRLGHHQWGAMEGGEWRDWLMSDVDRETVVRETAAAIEKRITARWIPCWAKQRALVAGFIHANPAALNRQPDTGHPDSSKAWASPRSWENAARALASAQAHEMSEFEGDMFAGGFVGMGTMGELITYRAKADLPDPMDVLDGKVTFKPDTKRLDRTYAVLGGVTSAMMGIHNGLRLTSPTDVKKDKDFMRRFDTLVELITKVADVAIDLCWGPAQQVAKAGLHGLTKESGELMRRLIPMMNATAKK